MVSLPWVGLSDWQLNSTVGELEKNNETFQPIKELINTIAPTVKGTDQIHGNMVNRYHKIIQQIFAKLWNWEKDK